MVYSLAGGSAVRGLYSNYYPSKDKSGTPIPHDPVKTLNRTKLINLLNMICISYTDPEKIAWAEAEAERLFGGDQIDEETFTEWEWPMPNWPEEDC